jgi:hypothetical protein
MKTRTLLLLSVGTALAILLAGGVFLLQLASQDDAAVLTSIGDAARVGDVTVTVLDAEESGGVLAVDVEIGGLDDDDGIDTFRLVTGDRRLSPLGAGSQDAAAGRCRSITVEATVCRIDFDVSASETSSRVLVMRRGDDQTNWRLA